MLEGCIVYKCFILLIQLTGLKLVTMTEMLLNTNHIKLSVVYLSRSPLDIFKIQTHSNLTQFMKNFVKKHIINKQRVIL